KIGQGIAIRLGKEGAKVVCCDIKSCDETIEAIKKAGSEALFVEADITKWENCEKVFRQAIEKWNKVDILVNNAGVSTRLAIDEEPVENWYKVVEIDLHAVWLMCKAAIPIMKKNGFGRIINIASVAGIVGFTNHGVYCAAKGGVINLTKALAVEVVKNGITVNAVNPMVIKTDLFVDQGNPLVGEFLEKMTNMIPIGRLSTPDDIAGAVVYFAGPDGGYVTGQILNVDGGFTSQ
ncbi:MAG: SDR family oxidoreductase, partial [Actinobacteria bacterium]|nr:SDR family oxidoreductase [Actinomycetota bacterium]